MNCGMSSTRIVAAMLHSFSYCLVEPRPITSFIADSASASDMGPTGFSAWFGLGNSPTGGSFVGADICEDADDLDLLAGRPCRPVRTPSANTTAIKTAAPKSFFVITCFPDRYEWLAPIHLL